MSNGPPMVRRRGPPIPEEIARQIAPEEFYRPPHDTSGGRTKYEEPPYAGEWREEKLLAYSGPLITGPIAGPKLDRPWALVGFGINPGNLPAPPNNTIIALLFALVRGNKVLIATLNVTQAAGTALGAVVQAGAMCELDLAVQTNAVGGVTGITASIWGHPFH